MRTELKRWLYTCDCCGAKEIIECGPIPSLPENWQHINVLLNDGDSRTSSQELCLNCLVFCDFCHGQGRVPKPNSPVTNANMLICKSCDGTGVLAKHDRRVQCSDKAPSSSST